MIDDSRERVSTTELINLMLPAEIPVAILNNIDTWRNLVRDAKCPS